MIRYEIDNKPSRAQPALLGGWVRWACLYLILINTSVTQAQTNQYGQELYVIFPFVSGPGGTPQKPTFVTRIEVVFDAPLYQTTFGSVDMPLSSLVGFDLEGRTFTMDFSSVLDNPDDLEKIREVTLYWEGTVASGWITADGRQDYLIIAGIPDENPIYFSWMLGVVTASTAMLTGLGLRFFNRLGNDFSPEL